MGRSGRRTHSRGDASGAPDIVQRIHFQGPRWDTGRGTLGVCKSLNSPLEERAAESQSWQGRLGCRTSGENAQRISPPRVQTKLSLVEIIAIVRKGTLTDISSAFSELKWVPSSRAGPFANVFPGDQGVGERGGRTAQANSPNRGASFTTKGWVQSRAEQPLG